MRWLVALLVLVSAPVAAACMWDYDTLREERLGLPGVAEVVAGLHQKHSDFFYERRVERMREHLAETPGDLDAIDNLAVALENLGRIGEAIDTLAPVVAEHPGRYTAHANLGTSHLHRYLRDKDAADLEAGIAHIERALAINPDAHFGRERYQLMLATERRDRRWADVGSFVTPILIGEDVELDRAADKLMQARSFGRGSDEIDDAIEGIVGMMRFGTGTSPHLSFALGDLLAARGDKRLALRAYVRALDLGHPTPGLVRGAMGDVAQFLEDLESHDVAGVERIVRAELAEDLAFAEAWVADFQAWEDGHVRETGRPPADEDYVAYLDEHPRELPMQSALASSWSKPVAAGGAKLSLVLAALIAVPTLLVALHIWRALKQRRRVATVPAA